MARLTFDGNFCDIVKCDSTPGGTFCESGTCSLRKIWERLKEYEDAEQDSRLVVLPCKVGDTVYGIKPVKKVDGSLDYEMKHGDVLAFKILESGVICMVSAEEQFGYPVAFRIEDFGKTVFLTRGAAEAAMKEEKVNDLP